ncbi:hypothetical protein ACFRAE_15200 [Sphingobacterium sp. HJSM2_6]|uniref:hypothetical protein n=1 Tax=Sphingobacterium sp. HJSM2_6 TaxID=3366264 RepID=UPI003BD75C4D
MRQIVATILLILYSVCSTGATIHLHHCGKNTDISWSQDAKKLHDQCPHCQDNHAEILFQQDLCTDSSSCKDVQVELKSDYDQLQSKSSFDFNNPISPCFTILHWIVRSLYVPISLEQSSNYHHYSFHIHDDPVYLKHCVLII